jgi:uncharacterized damage-inducible protein DinB
VADVKCDLISLSDHAYERTRRRLDGLTDDEYFWEPVPICWSLRLGSDGEHYADSGALDDSGDGAPFTTIAWRLWHLVGCYGSVRNAIWLGVDRPAGGFEQDDPASATAAAGLDALERAHTLWCDVLEALPSDAWSDPLVAVAGPFGGSDRASFVLHQLDEQIHHGAELGMLRDLYSARVR